MSKPPLSLPFPAFPSFLLSKNNQRRHYDECDYLLGKKLSKPSVDNANLEIKILVITLKSAVFPQAPGVFFQHLV